MPECFDEFKKYFLVLVIIVFSFSSIVYALQPTSVFKYRLNTSGLIGYWKFDEGSGITASDSSGYGHHGTLKNQTGSCSVTGCPSWVLGKLGKALEFDGIGDYVTINMTNYNETITNKFTWAAWINVKSLPNVLPRIMDKVFHYLTIQNNPGNQRLGYLVIEVVNISGSAFDYYATTVNFSLPENQNRWFFVTAVYNGSFVSMYINGAEAKTRFITQCTGCTVLNNLRNTTGRNLTVGGKASRGREFNGTIDEVTVWNRSLSDREIFLLYNDGLKMKRR